MKAEHDGRYFKISEFACKCGQCDNGVQQELIDALDKVRLAFGKPIIVNCGFRCEEHNSEVGGEPNSVHKMGYAADISSGAPLGQLFDAVMAVPEFRTGGLGVYFGQNFIHVDLRGLAGMKSVSWVRYDSDKPLIYGDRGMVVSEVDKHFA